MISAGGDRGTDRCPGATGRSAYGGAHVGVPIHRVDPFRADTRFQALVSQMRIPEDGATRARGGEDGERV